MARGIRPIGKFILCQFDKNAGLRNQLISDRGHIKLGGIMVLLNYKSEGCKSSKRPKRKWEFYFSSGLNRPESLNIVANKE